MDYIKLEARAQKGYHMNPIQVRLLNFYREQFNMKEEGLAATFRQATTLCGAYKRNSDPENNPDLANRSEMDDFTTSSLKIVRKSTVNSQVAAQDPYRRLYTAFRKGTITEDQLTASKLEVEAGYKPCSPETKTIEAKTEKKIYDNQEDINPIESQENTGYKRDSSISGEKSSENFSSSTGKKDLASHQIDDLIELYEFHDEKVAASRRTSLAQINLEENSNTQQLESHRLKEEYDLDKNVLEPLKSRAQDLDFDILE